MSVEVPVSVLTDSSQFEWCGVTAMASLFNVFVAFCWIKKQQKQNKKR